ncbi:hypothetical protein WSM22_39880 [Cytophagales bacterium WSM2-2]|nr:hypothetical protein WSM22_39880 [Cytophagales bacterium WSM2-2]
MDARFFSMMTNYAYSSLWNKYRPVILQLMVATEEGPQKYRLFDHEFKAADAKAKNYLFQMSVYEGKALNNIKESGVAQDLLRVLNTSRKASELLTEHQFEFSMDRQFMFHVTRTPKQVG